MNRRRWLWWMTATPFTIANAAGTDLAISRAEQPHAIGHVVLTAIGVFWLWRITCVPAMRSSQRCGRRMRDWHTLQKSVDAVAAKVERIDEAQRYQTKRGMAEVKDSASKQSE